MSEGSWTPERLAAHTGPALGKHLRREIKRQINLLYEHIMIIRLIDPQFERELQALGALEFLNRYTGFLVKQRDEVRAQLREHSLQLRAGAGDQES